MLTAMAMFCLACPSQMGNENIGEASPSENEYSFVIWEGKFPKKMPAGSQVTVPVTLLNNGSKPWDTSGGKPFLLSYHWKHPGGSFDSNMFWGIKTPLPPYVGVSELIKVDMVIKTPAKAKYYDLVVDIIRGDSMIRDEVIWLEEETGKAYEMRVEVVENE